MHKKIKQLLFAVTCLTSMSLFAASDKHPPFHNNDISDLIVEKSISSWLEKQNYSKKQFAKLAKNKKARNKVFASLMKAVEKTQKKMKQKTVVARANIVTIKDHDYLATQAPKEKAHIPLFWEQVINHNSSLIVTLLVPKEKKVVKCIEYWNTQEYPTIVKGWQIQRTAEETIAQGKKDCTIVQRTFEATNLTTSETRTITQLHYTGWPDYHPVPD